MTYIVSTEIMNPLGICLGEEFNNGEDYIPYVNGYASRNGRCINFYTYHGTYINGGESYTHYFCFDIFDLIRDYIRRVYNLSDDIEINPSFDFQSWNSFQIRRLQGTQETFETEAEALEYVDLSLIHI